MREFMANVRALTDKERALCHSVFGDAIDYDPVTLCHKKWAFFQPKNTVMAPMGHVHFHPKRPHWREDFGDAPIFAQGLFIHEMVHVWQYQQGIFLPIKRHIFCRYDYSIKPGWPLEKYGLEQQAEIVRHAFLLREGKQVAGAPLLASYKAILPFAFADSAFKNSNNTQY